MFNLCKQSLSSTTLGDGSEDRGKGRQEIPDLENSAKNLAKNSFDILVLLKKAGTKNVVINTLQMFTDKGLIDYYFCMLLLHMKMCKLFKGY